jgi:hypothetical protein
MILREVTPHGTKIKFLKEWAIFRDTFDGYPPVGTPNHLTTAKRPILTFSPDHVYIKNEQVIIEKFYTNRLEYISKKDCFCMINGKRQCTGTQIDDEDDWDETLIEPSTM